MVTNTGTGYWRGVLILVLMTVSESSGDGWIDDVLWKGRKDLRMNVLRMLELKISLTFKNLIEG